MDLFNFAGGQRYRSRVPLKQLQFTVTVYRAIVVEEDKSELLAEKTVMWDAKVPSPAETLSLYKDLTHLLGRIKKETPLGGVGSGGNTDAATLHLGTGPSVSSRVFLPHLPNMPCLPSPLEAVAQHPKLQFFIFTRPSVEDFINRAEEDVPVDPSPGPSLLAPIILRQHRRDHQPNRRMFLMWTAGELAVHDRSPSVVSRRGPLEEASGAGSGVVGGVSHAVASPVSNLVPGVASSPPTTIPTSLNMDASIGFDKASWDGDERVLCTLTADEDEHYFTAKPTLNELHTLVVDAAYIYTFRVTVSHAKAAAKRQGCVIEDERQLSFFPDGRHLASSSVAPLEVLSANIAHIARSAEEQFESLDIGRDAVARRLLRQVAMLVPPERSSADRGVTASAAAATSASAASEAAEGQRGQEGCASSTMFSSAAQRTGTGGVTNNTAPLTRSRRRALSGGGHLSRTSLIHGAPPPPRGCCQYYVFGTIDRCVGIAESTIFVRCQLIEDHAPTTYDTLSEPLPPTSADYDFTSQLAHASAFIEAEFMLDIDHVLNVPFEYSSLGAAVPSSPLRLIATAFTEGTYAQGVQAPVGYACASLPIASPGRHKLVVPVWAPHKTGAEFLRSTLLGGAPGLVDARQAGPASVHRTGLNVKEGLYADSVGKLHITVSILHRK